MPKAKTCDNKSVGQIIKKGDAFVVIERRNYPQAYALVAGHCDGESFGDAAIKEAREEANITIEENEPVWQGRIDNPCKREGGSFHDWLIFEAKKWSGELKAGDDAKRFFLCSPEELGKLAARTEYFAEKYGVSPLQVGKLTLRIFGNPAKKNTDPEWAAYPGLEPVWYFILKQIHVLA
jgi:8-oxo-dGTP pyrophosphatase MutT (NUDIX family)